MLPQPTTIPYTPEELRNLFVRVAVDTVPDPKWHYRIAVPLATKMRPSAGRVAPSAREPLQSLGLFYREDVALDLEVIGVLLGREIDPAHWLELFLEHNRVPVTAMKVLPLGGGASAGDGVRPGGAAPELAHRKGRPRRGRLV